MRVSQLADHYEETRTESLAAGGSDPYVPKLKRLQFTLNGVPQMERAASRLISELKSDADIDPEELARECDMQDLAEDIARLDPTQ